MIRSGNYGVYKGKEYHVTREEGNKKLEIYTYDKSKTDNTFAPCNQQGERECYKRYVWDYEISKIYCVDTYAVGNENKEMLVLKELGDQYLVSVGSGDIDLARKYQWKEADQGIYHGWINKKDVQLIEKCKPVHYLDYILDLIDYE